MLRDVSKAPNSFESHLYSVGLKSKSYKGIFGLLRVKTLVKFSFWGGVSAGVSTTLLPFYSNL